MNLAHAYAVLIQEAAAANQGAAFADTLVKLMKARGHLSLLSQVIKRAERMPEKDEAVVYVKNQADLTKLKPKIKASLKALGSEEKPNVIIDPRVVGGYLARLGGKVIDSTYRSALVSLYHKSVRS